MKLLHRAGSNEVARELTLTQLANRALASALYLGGFNAAGVVHFIDIESMEDLIEVTWGDQKLMRLPRMRTPQSWALAYAEDEPCTRPSKMLLLPRSVLSESVEALDRRFTAHLLELAQDPAVIDEPVSQKAAP